MLKIGLALLLVLTSSLEVPVPATIHSAHEQLTPTETQAVEEVVNRFVQRMEETGDFAVVVKELYTEDFIQRYVAQQQKKLTEAKTASSAIYFAPGLEYNSSLLKQATTEDWQRFYTAVHSILCYGILIGLNHSAPVLLEGKEPDEKILNNILPPQVVNLFNGHPILKNFVRNQGRPIVIETVEEMRSAVTTLEQAVAMLHQEPPKLTEKSRKVIEMLKTVFRKEHPPEVLEHEFYGYPAGTRIFAALTPLMYALRIVRIANKYQIVWAEPFGD